MRSLRQASNFAAFLMFLSDTSATAANFTTFVSGYSKGDYSPFHPCGGGSPVGTSIVSWTLPEPPVTDFRELSITSNILFTRTISVTAAGDIAFPTASSVCAEYEWGTNLFGADGFDSRTIGELHYLKAGKRSEWRESARFAQTFTAENFSVSPFSDLGDYLMRVSFFLQGIDPEPQAEILYYRQFQSYAGNVRVALLWGAVPAPATLPLFALGMAGLVAARRRRT